MARSQFFIAVNKAQEKNPHVHESTDIADVMKYFARGKWLVLDLDNTIVEPEDEHDELGSDQWFVSFLSYAKSLDLKETNINAAVCVIAIYHAVQYQLKLKLIQPEIVEIINAWLACGNKVVFLTARGPEILEPTLRQLNRYGIDLTDLWGEDILALDIGDGDAQHPPIFAKGGIFCGGKAKEKSLLALMTILGEKPDIVMADDKQKYLDAVIEMVKAYGGKADGLRFGRLDEKVLKHDFQKAQQKLQEISDDLLIEAQEAMTKLGLKR